MSDVEAAPDVEAALACLACRPSKMYLFKNDVFRVTVSCAGSEGQAALHDRRFDHANGSH